ncbi:MAG: VTT domain-containing protein [Candidatus Magasanikbacteria bacterium]|nr:VTT domain-containing protein [Candidatus Magasanikbacteria bacterium]MCA9390764.1 VTT domain-containing protein [Candidatus Magasanikbacteria bacterium]USN52530.1 MAG: VTT domain-containing protein [Candidatus Nomurabacteria bacterium]HPF95594.1 VTT domain-containing protein [bacterium]
MILLEHVIAICQAVIYSILHVDRMLGGLIAQYPTGVYSILFLIIFVETGLVIMPFLPGDSLLFATGSFAALGVIDINLALPLLILAAITGDTVNYWIGREGGTRLLKHKHLSKLINDEHLAKAQRFYEKHAFLSVVLARFMPIIRTFAPFVAGMTKMHYRQFMAYNALGGIAWVSLFTLLGYWFGNLPIVQEYFGIVIIAIIILSFMPLVYEFALDQKAKRLNQTKKR